MMGSLGPGARSVSVARSVFGKMVSFIILFNSSDTISILQERRESEARKMDGGAGEIK